MLIALSRSWEMRRSNCSDTEDKAEVLDLEGSPREPRLERHQLAHQVDEGIQLVARDANRAGRRLGPLLQLLHVLLLDEGGLDLGLGDELILDEDFAELLLGIEGLGNVARGETSPRSTRISPKRLASPSPLRDDLDLQLGQILDEDEDIPYRVLVDRGGKQHFPPCVAGLGLQFLEAGHILHVRKHVRYSERRELLD